MEKSVFSFNSYKDIMTFFLTGENRRGQLSRAAEFLNCQRSYLSRVINEEFHLTQDHAFRMTKFLRFNDGERDFFQTLVEFERSGDPGYRSHLQEQIKEMKRKHDSVSVRAKRTHLLNEQLNTQYFTSWVWSAIHFLTAIPKYQNIQMISDRLGLKPDMVKMYLLGLETQGFVSRSGDKWFYASGEFHLAKESPLLQLYHQNWRQKALLSSQDLTRDDVHFTGILTLTQKDADQLKELVLKFIEEANKIAGPSKPEEAVVLLCDFFSV